MTLRLAWKDRLYGQVIPAVPVPRGQDGSIAEEAQERYIDYMKSQPIGGVAVWAHTGRGLHLTDRQRQQVLAAWRRGLAEKMIIAGVGAPSQAGQAAVAAVAREMARSAKEGGADAVLAYPPTAYRGSLQMEEKIIEYHEAIAAAGLPVIVFYLYEDAGGINYSLSLLRRLFQIPSVVGIKMATLDSLMTFQSVSRLIQAEFPQVALISGEDRMLGYTFMRGASSALIGLGAACPGPQVALLRALLSQRFEDFLRLSNEVDYFAEATFTQPMEQYIQRMLWALAVLGVIPEEATYDPLQPRISRQEKDLVAAAVRRLDRLEVGGISGGIDCCGHWAR